MCVVLIFNIVMTELTDSFHGSEPGPPLLEPTAASPAGPSTSAAVPTGVYRQ